MALHEGSEFVNGLPKDTNLDTYTPLRMGDVPDIEIELMPSSETPVGLGEPATTVVAPAIGNAQKSSQSLKTWLSPGFSAVGRGLRTGKQSPPIIGSLYKWA